MKIHINFSANKTKLIEGDTIELQWSCPEGAATRLTIDNGFKQTALEVESNGEKKFRLNRSKGRTRLTLSATVDGKIYSKTLHVRVKEAPVLKARPVKESRNSGKPSKWISNVRFWWGNFVSRTRYMWKCLPEKKQLAYKVLGLVFIATLLPIISVKLTSLGLFIIVGYLFWVILKR